MDLVDPLPETFDMISDSSYIFQEIFMNNIYSLMNSQKQYADIYNKDRRVPPGIFGKQLQDYQKFVRNYFGIDSGNRELFIWHSTGRGKTMSALTISEPYSRLLLESPELEGFIYIIGSFASIDNFIGELTGEAGN